MVKTIEYLSLSALAYVGFKESDAGLTLDEIIRDEQEKKSRKDFNLDSPELSALQDPSSSRQILSDTNFKAVISFRSTFTNKTTSVLHHDYV